jgi:hypothetical protein
VVGNIGKNTITYEKLADSNSFSLALKNWTQEIGSVSIKELPNSNFTEIWKIIVGEASRNQGNATELIKQALKQLPEGKEWIIGIVSKFQDKYTMNRIFEKLGAVKDYAWNWVLKK